VLDDVKRIAKDNDVKLNDVVLALFGGALRRYLVKHNSLPEAPLVAGVPVSMRDDGDLAGNNELSAIFVSLGTDVEDPQQRLQAVHEHATQAKELHDAMGAAGLAGWTAVFAPAIVSLGAQLLIDRKLLARLPVLCNTIVSNVPGPPVTLYFGGARLTALYPLGPIFHGPGINLTIVSSRDTIGFGLLSCPDLVPDLWELVDTIYDELCIHTGART
jgi:WS/DGAT/MGAT family acyltransferase